MSLADDVRNEFRKLREHKAFYAVAGASDVALGALRGLPEWFAQLQGKADLAALSGRAVEYVMVAGARVVQTYDELAERGMQVAGRPGPQHTAGIDGAEAGAPGIGASHNGERPGAAGAAGRASAERGGPGR